MLPERIAAANAALRRKAGLTNISPTFRSLVQVDPFTEFEDAENLRLREKVVEHYAKLLRDRREPKPKPRQFYPGCSPPPVVLPKGVKREKRMLKLLHRGWAPQSTGNEKRPAPRHPTSSKTGKSLKKSGISQQLRRFCKRQKYVKGPHWLSYSQSSLWESVRLGFDDVAPPPPAPAEALPRWLMRCVSCGSCVHRIKAEFCAAFNRDDGAAKIPDQLPADGTLHTELFNAQERRNAAEHHPTCFHRITVPCGYDTSEREIDRVGFLVESEIRLASTSAEKLRKLAKSAESQKKSKPRRKRQPAAV